MVSGFFIVLTLNLTNLTVAAHLHNVETIDLTLNGAGGAGMLKLDGKAIINLSDLSSTPPPAVWMRARCWWSTAKRVTLCNWWAVAAGTP